MQEEAERRCATVAVVRNGLDGRNLSWSSRLFAFYSATSRLVLRRLAPFCLCCICCCFVLCLRLALLFLQLSPLG